MKKRIQLLLTSAFFVYFLVDIQAQRDSMILSNGDIIVGEIKSMDKGVLIIETDYSEDDFTLKWVEVKEVYSQTRFLITLHDGRRMNSILTTTKSGTLVIENEIGELEEINILDLVFLQELENKFWSRVDASIDAGVNFNKANHLRQINVSSTLGYLTEAWGVDFYFTYSGSSQDSVSSTIRKEAGGNYRYFLKEDWYILPEATYLSNTEQALESRITAKFGVGRYINHTNQSYWGLIGGLSYNEENFTNATPHRNSVEAYAGSELNFFDTGDLSLFSTLYIYPSLTEKGRVRTDFNLDIKYEFYSDFYIKGNVDFNYDNQPAVVGNESDYVFGFAVGWEL
jgi:heat shock protein HspQ